MSNIKDDIDLIDSVSFIDRNRYIFNTILGKEFRDHTNSYSLVDVLYLFRNFPNNREDISSIFLLKTMYSILLNKLLVEERYKDILSLLTNHKVDYKRIPENIKDLVLKPSKFNFDPQIAYKKFDILFNYNNTNERTKDLENIRDKIKENINSIIKIYLEIAESNINEVIIEEKLDKKKSDMILRSIAHIKNNYKDELVKDLGILYEKSDGKENQKFSDTIEKLGILMKVKDNIDHHIHRFGRLIEILKDIRHNNPDLEWLNELIEISKKEFIYRNDLKRIIDKYMDNSNNSFSSDILFEAAELAYIYFKFLNLSEILTNIEEKIENNYIAQFIRILEYIDFSPYNQLQKKEIIISDILFIDLFSYDLPELKYEDEIDGMQITNDGTVENFLLNNPNSIKRKLSKWKLYGNKSALPINSLDILENILFQNNVLEYLKDDKDLGFTKSIIEVFTNISRNISKNQNHNLSNIDFIFREHPLINLFVDVNDKNKMFVEIFQFIFDESMTKINYE